MRDSLRLAGGFLPIAAAFALAAAMAFEVGRRPTPADAEPFHAAAAEAIASLPDRIGPWEGVEMPVPTSARTLLKPNALLSRIYRNRQTGDQASVVLVQCRDTRDMAGHYPPICYPGQGWVEDEAQRRTVEIPFRGRVIRAVRYDFGRQGFDRDRHLAVYNFFAIPGQGLPIDMTAVRAAAADYTARPFGAAQVQVVFEGRRPPDDERAVAATLLEPMAPVIDLLSDGRWRSR